jgi:hypothetical protein
MRALSRGIGLPIRWGLPLFPGRGTRRASDRLLTRENAERLLVAPVLTVAVVPFLYAVTWWSQREQRKLDGERVHRLKETWPDKPLTDDERSA